MIERDAVIEDRIGEGDTLVKENILSIKLLKYNIQEIWYTLKIPKLRTILCITYVKHIHNVHIYIYKIMKVLKAFIQSNE